MAASVPQFNTQGTTLNKFGVPVLPNASGSGLGILMPKLKHRFQVTVTNFGIATTPQIFTQQVATCGRPSIQFNNTPLHSYNNVMYIAQKPEWQPIELTLRDDITNGITSSVSYQLQKQMNHYTQSAASAGYNYKFQMMISTLNGNVGATNAAGALVGGVAAGIGGAAGAVIGAVASAAGVSSSPVIEQWYLEGCYLETVSYDSLDFSSSEPVMITLTVRYDNATQGDEAITGVPAASGANAAG
jgi:hypothetical protein